MADIDLMNFTDNSDGAVSPLNAEQKWYALYQVIEKPFPNSPIVENAHNNNNNNNSSDDESSSSVSLSVLASNLSGTDEITIRIVMGKKVAKGSVVPDGPSLVTGVTLGDTNTNERRYSVYCALLKPDWLKGGESAEKGFLVCYASSCSQELELFQNELDAHSKTLIVLLDANLSGLATTVTTCLESWYFQSVRYINRAAQLMRPGLPAFLQAVLVGARIELKEIEEKHEKDLRQFIDACRIPLLEKPDAETDRTQRIWLSGGDGGITVDGDLDPTPFFCQHWASILLNSGTVDTPVAIRNVIEEFKLKLIQDVNGIKRLVQQAIEDYYALFKALTFLKHSGYASVLLRVLKEENIHNKGDGATLVIDVLEEFSVAKLT